MLLPSRADEVHVQIEGIVVLHNIADEVLGHGEIVVLLASRAGKVPIENLKKRIDYHSQTKF